MIQRIFSLCIALLAISLAVSSQAAQGMAKVVKLHGAARYSNGNNVWVPVSIGIVLKPGTVIQTASESSVDLLLSDEDTIRTTPVVNNQGDSKSKSKALLNVVRLRDNTLLAIDKLSSEKTGVDTVTDTQLDLRAGTIFGNVKKTSAASRYEIKLPNGVAGIRGTIYSISASGIITVYVGSIVLTYFTPADPTQTITKVVNAGQQYDLNVDVYHPTPMGAREEAQRQAEEMSQISINEGISDWRPDHTQTFISPVVSPVIGD